MICALGVDRRQVWKRLLAGETRMGRITQFDPAPLDLEDCVVSQVADADLEKALAGLPQPAGARRLGRFRQMALVAAAEAIQDAGLNLQDDEIRNAGSSILGTMCGGAAETERVAVATHKGKKPKASDYVGKRPTVALQDIAREFRVGGPMFAIDAACASGAYALTQACNLIAAGRASWCLAGGVEASLVASNLKAVAAIGATCKLTCSDLAGASRPFDQARSGYVPAEGACFLLLEDEAHARGRGARYYARVAGFAEDTLEDHPTRISAQFAETVMRRALLDAGISVEELGWIKAHATSTPQGDQAEAVAIRKLVGAHDILCSAPKSATGHLLGASGAIETAFSALSLHEQVIPPTINLENLDPACPIHCARIATPSTFNYVLANSWGFGGSACCIVLARPKPG